MTAEHRAGLGGPIASSGPADIADGPTTDVDAHTLARVPAETPVDGDFAADLVRLRAGELGCGPG